MPLNLTDPKGTPELHPRLRGLLPPDWTSPNLSLHSLPAMKQAGWPCPPTGASDHLALWLLQSLFDSLSGPRMALPGVGCPPPRMQVYVTNELSQVPSTHPCPVIWGEDPSFTSVSRAD